MDRYTYMVPLLLALAACRPDDPGEDWDAGQDADGWADSDPDADIGPRDVVEIECARTDERLCSECALCDLADCEHISGAPIDGLGCANAVSTWLLCLQRTGCTALDHCDYGYDDPELDLLARCGGYDWRG